MSNPFKNSILKTIKEYVLVSVGILMYVTGWSIFLIPNNLVGGGVTGIGSIIQYATGFNMGYSFFILNGILLIIAFFVMGTSFGGKTIWAIFLASVGLKLLPGFIPDTLIQTLALDNGKLMCTIMGGITAGVGIGLSISQGGSTGGTDIIALIVCKYKPISPGKMILWMDAVIIIGSFFIPSFTADGAPVGWADKFTVVVYGLILVTVNSSVVDLYLNGSKQSVQLFILSQKYKEIADCITQTLHRGVTVLPAQGWYSKVESHVLMVITRKTDLNLLLKYIKSIDPDAFLSVSAASGVYGKGFDVIKASVKKSVGKSKS